MPFEFPTITIDFNAILALADKPFFNFLTTLFIKGGWVIFLIILFWVLVTIINYRALEKKEKNMKYVLLAVDVPRNNENGPEVTERLFAHLATAGSSGGLESSSGPKLSVKIKTRFSFEIISDGGKIQFLVRAPEEYRDLVEAAFYGEYPNAEITEVEDYTEGMPEKFPDPEYDIWGAEIVLYNKDVYPIRTYPAFEHSLSGEFRDPISNTLEVLSKAREGEKIWIQIIISFAGLAWKRRGARLVNELIGKKEKEKIGGVSDLLGALVGKGLGSLSNLGYEVLSGGEKIEGSEVSRKEAPPSLVSYLSPGGKETVSAIEKKIAKIGFKTKIRFIYLSPKDIFNVHRIVPGVLGSFNQFSTLDLNGFRPDKFVKTHTSEFDFFPKRKIKKIKEEIIKGYKLRSIVRGANPFVLNIEELATLYHFPVISVEAPLVKKTGSKRGEPPFALPVKDSF